MIRNFVSAAALVLAAACSSSSDSGGGALSVPSQMTIVSAQGTGGGAPAYIPKPGAHAIEGSDYMTDRVDVWVQDESMEALELVNVIFCSMKQTRFDHVEVFNNGPYTALVGCEEGRGDRNSNAGQVEYQDFTVDSVRGGGDQPHVVKFWFDESQDNGGGPAEWMRLYGKLTIFESPSEERPFGRFVMSWKQLERSLDPTTTPSMTGSLATVDRSDGKAEFVLFNSEGDVDGQIDPGNQAFRMRARVITNAGFTEGKAYTEMKVAFNHGSGKQVEGAEFHVQFNQRYLARKKVGNSTVIKVYDRKDFTTSGFRYGIYLESTEERVRDKSGFPLQTAGGAHGFVGYHGMWFPDDVTITNGQSLTRRGSGGSGTSYTAFLAPGRLEKQTRFNSTLGNMKNEEFVTWDSSNSTDMLVQWTGSAFNKVATFNISTGEWESVTPTSVASQYSGGQWVHMHSSARGDVQFTWPSSGGPADATTVVIWRRTIINGDSSELANGDLMLHGYFNMLKTNITSSQANYNGETPYFPDANNVSQGKAYVFKKSTLTLTLGDNDVALADSVKITSGPRQHGLDCGPMVSTALTSLGQMPSQVTTYMWMTGSNSWNRYQTVKDSNGNFVAFTQPKRFEYTHQEQGNPYNGKTVTLELEGDDLHGIPYEKAPGSNWHYPGFTIPRGSIVSDTQGTRYLVKMLEGEQRMNEVSDPNAVIAAEGFDLDVTLTPPESSYADPAIGSRPSVTAPPKFVDGELQK